MRRLDEKVYSYDPKLRFTEQVFPDQAQSPSWFDTLNASLAYQYQPYINAMHNRSRYARIQPDPEYVPADDIEGYEQYKNDLLHAKTKEHMNDLKAQIDHMKQTRETIANSSLMNQFTTQLFDPINLFALPFGGPTLGIAKSAIRVGAGATVIQAPLEAGRQIYDPTSTPAESVINMGTTFAIGSTLGGLLAVPSTMRANTFLKTQQEISEMNNAIALTSPEQRLQIGNRDLRIFDPEGLKIDMNRFSDADVQRLTNEFEAKAYLQTEFGFFDTKVTQDFSKYMKGENALRTLETKKGAPKSAYSLKENLFTRSWLYKGITTPFKRTLQNKRISQETKFDFIRLMGDHGVAMEGNQVGVKTPHSVYIKASEYEGEWVAVHDQLMTLYGEASGKGKPFGASFDYGTFFRRGYDDWLSETWKKSLLQPDNLNEIEEAAVQAWNGFFDKWDDRLQASGLIANEANLSARNRQLSTVLDDYGKEYNLTKTIKLKSGEEIKQPLSARVDDKISEVFEELDNNTSIKPNERNILKNQIAKLKDERDQVRANLKKQEGDVPLPTLKEKFFPRFWNKQAINDRMEDFKEILRKHFKTKAYDIVKTTTPRGNVKFERQLVNLSEKEIESKIDATINKILYGQDDPMADDAIFYGYGKSKHFKHRQIEIANSEVVDFIIQNPVQVMMAYTNRTAAQHEFVKSFGHADPEIVANNILLREAKQGMDINNINKLRRDFLHSYDRVAGVVLQNPEALSNRIADVLKNLATLNYLGSAGFSTLPDAAAIMMTNELKPLFKQLFRVLNDERVRMNANEARLAGEMLEILKGDVHMRLMEDSMNNVFNNGIVSKTKNVFFQLNLLGPMTRIMKHMSSMAHSHTIIDYSVKMAQKRASNLELEYLSRYGMDLDDAKKIDQLVKDNVIENSNGFYLANTKAWKDENTARMFRRTLNATVKNTVLMGSPADKPINVDGVFYIPMRVARMMGMKEDRRIKGYARVENALIGLPFQFYSYSFAALNKITTLYTQDQVLNRAVGIAASMGLAYMGMQLKYRSNPFVLEQMPLEDKIARSFDMSGLAALYSDMYYTGIQMSLALGGPDLTMGMISPKFPQEYNPVDAILAPLGSGPSIAYDLGTSAYKFTQGDYDGAKDFISNLPFARLWFLRDFTNDLGRTVAGRLG